MANNQDEMNEAARGETSGRQISHDAQSKSPLNEHDTPPPIVFMQGSCIIEVPNPGDAIAAGEGMFKSIQERLAADRAFIAHVKVVDGSGDMLFKLDNNSKDRLTVSFRLADEDSSPAGELRFSVEAGATLPAGKKIAQKLNDPPMNGKKRMRFRCMDAATEKDVNITHVSIEKDLTSGSLPIYNLAFADLKSEGMELKVMLWLERH